ncbi:RecX family transcriptional regulator [Kineosporia succinea]|uniref:Regulatory protein RecX n=1 Tax=Kineosporia succinea TaxID=84632 RepID=A0ABT9NW44_9ACTN|nr:RecX family transcriptional regulator [Kineosporia succinea]MDP9824637.1 SOS response regulatory protein OraA/RecX [Kineosporia succinea]
MSLDGTRLNQHDLRDMIAQKEAEWRAGQGAAEDSDDGGNRHGASGRRGAESRGAESRRAESRRATGSGADVLPDTDPGAGNGEVQPQWSTPGWGPATAKSRVGRTAREEVASPGESTPGARKPRGLNRQRREAGDSPWGRSGNSLRRRPRSERRDADDAENPGLETSEGDDESGRAGREAGRERPRPPADPEQEARDILLRQLHAGARTRSQLAKVLAQKEIPDDVASAVLDRFEEVDLVDDAAFSQQYVETRHSGKGLAKRALAYELRQKGVADETVREAVDQLSSDDELATARDLVRKKARSMMKDDPERRLRRLAGMLARKGYSSGIAYQAIREELADLDAEALDHPDLD